MANDIIQNYKGTRDFYPEDMRVRNYIFKNWRKVCRQYGYEAYDTPMLELMDLYRLKDQTNEDMVREEIYSFTDRGDREVAIRPEMTPSVSRIVASRRQELGYPLRLYSIPSLWRYERPQRGRLREHWQLNVDIFGIDTVAAEHELLLLSQSLMKSVGATNDMYEIRVNHRELVNYILSDYLGLNDVQVPSMIHLADRKAKMEPSQFQVSVEQLLAPSQREDGTAEKLQNILEAKSLTELPIQVKLCKGFTELSNLLELLKNEEVNIVFDMSLMRGFDYYTGVVFEVFDTDPENNRAMFGGGRYDGLVEALGVEKLPTAGMGIGDVTFADFLESHNLIPELKSTVDAYVILIGDVYNEAQPFIKKLRKEGVRLAVDPTLRKIGKQIETASKKDIEYVLFIGAEELEADRYKLKNLKSGEEKDYGFERLVSKLEGRKGRNLGA